MALKEEQVPTQTAGFLAEEKEVAPLAITHASWRQQGAMEGTSSRRSVQGVDSTNAFQVVGDSFQK